MGDPILEVEDLTVGYHGAPVLRALDLTVAEGEVVALLGANGAGKTTTLRAISGLVRPMAGRIRYDGRDIASLTPPALVRLGLAHVPEGRGIFVGLTVAEHFRLNPPGHELDMERVLGYFPALDPLRSRRAGLLSGGEQQMLALAHALARRPRLLLVDELSLGLAPVLVERLLPIVRRYADESAAGVILVEQHIASALQIADRGIVLAHGEMTTEGTADALRNDRNLMVASYLGGQE
jgi:ABC-type branched-subunit amino acid transport system ATPase component